MANDADIPMPADATLLIVDDDRAFLNRLARAMEARGFAVETADTVGDGIAAVRRKPPAFAVVDMRLEDGNGLDVIEALHGARPDARGIVLTGYGSIATALEAVRRGAFDYLTKPVDADDVLRAFESGGEATAESVPSLHRVEWEHIQRVLADCGGNVSQAARLLGVHRRTLQRKLASRPPRR